MKGIKNIQKKKNISNFQCQLRHSTLPRLLITKKNTTQNKTKQLSDRLGWEIKILWQADIVASILSSPPSPRLRFEVAWTPGQHSGYGQEEPSFLVSRLGRGMFWKIERVGGVPCFIFFLLVLPQRQIPVPKLHSQDGVAAEAIAIVTLTQRQIQS